MAESRRDLIRKENIAVPVVFGLAVSGRYANSSGWPAPQADGQSVP